MQDNGSSGGDLDPPRPSLPTKGSAEITASLVANQIQLSHLILVSCHQRDHRIAIIDSIEHHRFAWDPVGDASGNRTHVSSVKESCLSHLTMAPFRSSARRTALGTPDRTINA